MTNNPGPGASQELEWQFLQCFGQPTLGEEIQEGPSSRPCLIACSHCENESTESCVKLLLFLANWFWEVPLRGFKLYQGKPQPGIRLSYLKKCHLFAADLLSVLEFDANGDYLATGDRGGRVVLLEQIVCSKVCHSLPCIFPAVRDFVSNPFVFTSFQVVCACVTTQRM